MKRETVECSGAVNRCVIDAIIARRRVRDVAWEFPDIRVLLELRFFFSLVPSRWRFRFCFILSDSFRKLSTLRVNGLRDEGGYNLNTICG